MGTSSQNSGQSEMSRTTAGSDATKPSRSDIKFMKEAAQGGMLEVKLGRIAMQNAASPEVRQFGERMVADHGKGNDELKSLARSENVALPDQSGADHEKEIQRLEKLSGPDFDREYMKMMVADHHKDIRAFEHEAQRGDDPEVKAFAAKTLPTLREHLSMAERARNAVAHAGTDKAGKAQESASRPEPSAGTAGQSAPKSQ